MKGGEGEKGSNSKKTKKEEKNKWVDLVTEQKSPNSVQGRDAHA